MSLRHGDRLGPYEIQALLGVGGMGEVYRGRDARLGRDVALKVISPRLVGDPALRRRFQREARAASVLNHPSIVTVYDVGESEGVSWIAMEWVEGRTLRQALAEGPLETREAVRVAAQVADGLAAAHAKGVIHRDLKPENVMLLGDGRSKILDFGLARQTAGEELGGEISQLDTRAGAPAEGTREGTILGTVGYMSPEQAAGRPVDFRCDQFSLGVLLYEMLAGRRAFARATAVETLSAIIREEPPPLAALRAGLARPLEDLVSRCLAKDPADRFASTRDLATALEELGSGASLTAPAGLTATQVDHGPAPGARFTRRWRAAPAALAVVLAVAAVLLWLRLGGDGEAIRSLAILPFANAANDPDAEYLGDGLTDSLIQQMSNLPSLKVMARATVFRFKGTADPQAAGRRLGVGAVVTGSVLRRGEHFVISAELIEIATGARLWGDRYDVPRADLIRVQDRIAMDIAAALRLRLSGAEKETLAEHGTRNPVAYELFLKAEHRMREETEEGELEAARLYEQAVKEDPRFVEAWVGLHSARTRGVALGFWAPPRGPDHALQEAERLDPQNILVRCALANRYFLRDWDWARAEKAYRELAGDRRLYLGQHWRPMNIFYWSRGRTDEAIAVSDEALRHAPGDPITLLTRADYLADAGRLEEALAGYRSLIQADPEDSFPHYGVAEVLRRRGDVAGAIAALRKAYDLSGEAAGVAALEGATTEDDYARAERVVARARLENLEAEAAERYVSPLALARLHAQLGDKERAIANLQAALAERSPTLVTLKAERVWDPVRDDPRFTAIVREVGIP